MFNADACGMVNEQDYQPSHGSSRNLKTEVVHHPSYLKDYLPS